jgi:hypothetical protein
LAQFYEFAQKWLKVFIENGIGLLFVFDGVALREKRRELDERRQQRSTEVNEILSMLNPIQNFNLEIEVELESLMFFFEKDDPKILNNSDDPSSIHLYQFLLIQILHQKNIKMEFAQGECE